MSRQSWFFLRSAPQCRWPPTFPHRRKATLSCAIFAFDPANPLPEVRMHYRTLGAPQRDAQGQVNNAVLILHGTTGSSTQFLRPEFAGKLYGPGQLLDASRYYLVIPDNIGHGQSSKPSDGLRARFPKYGYHDMVAVTTPPVDRGPPRRSSAAGDRHVDGRDARVAVG